MPKICKHCETEIEPGEMSIDNYCCDGQHAELLEAEVKRLQDGLDMAEYIINRIDKKYFTTRYWLSEFGKSR